MQTAEKAFKIAKAMEIDSKGVQVDKTREMVSPVAFHAVSNLAAGKTQKPASLSSKANVVYSARSL